jgi:hypothetical protein
MSKITALTPKTYQNKPSGFTVTFEDGRSGNMEEKQSDKGLRVGDEVVVTEIPYTSKAGKQSTLYGVRLNVRGTQLPQAAPPQTPATPAKDDDTIFLPPLKGVVKAKTVTEMKYEGRIYCFKLAVKCFLGREIEFKNVREYFTEWVDMMDAAIDEIKV